MAAKKAKAPKATAAEKAIFAAIAKSPMTKDALAASLGPKFGGRKAIGAAWASLKARGVAATTRSKAGRWMLAPVKA